MTTKQSVDLLFVVEYFDPAPQLKKKFLLKYFPESHAVEMVDVKTKKMFLKKSPCPQEVTLADFVLGAKVFLYSRELEIIDYGDGATRQRLHHQLQKCCALITSGTYFSL